MYLMENIILIMYIIVLITAFKAYNTIHVPYQSDSWVSGLPSGNALYVLLSR